MSEESEKKPIAIQSSGQTLIGRLPVKFLEDSDLKTLEGLIDKACAQDPQISTVVVDLTQVTMMPSLALGLLVQMNHKCRARKQQLRLAGIQPAVRKVFSITKLDKIFQISDTVEAATQAADERG